MKNHGTQRRRDGGGWGGTTTSFRPKASRPTRHSRRLGCDPPGHGVARGAVRSSERACTRSPSSWFLDVSVLPSCKHAEELSVGPPSRACTRQPADDPPAIFASPGQIVCDRMCDAWAGSPDPAQTARYAVLVSCCGCMLWFRLSGVGAGRRLGMCAWEGRTPRHSAHAGQRHFADTQRQ